MQKGWRLNLAVVERRERLAKERFARQTERERLAWMASCLAFQTQILKETFDARDRITLSGP